MIGRQVRIAHGHRDISMSHEILHGTDIYTGHDEATGKGMAQDMGAERFNRTLASVP